MDLHPIRCFVMNRFEALVVLIAVVAVSACSGIEATATDAGTNVGAVDAASSSHGEAGGSQDTGTTSDAGSDSAPPDGGGGIGFCTRLSPPPTFCSDFDEGAGSLAPWTVITDNFYYGDPDGGTVAIDTSTFAA